MHLTITDKLTELYTFKNVDRLRFGTILTDACSDMNKSHLKKELCGKIKKTYDLNEFRDRFGDLMMNDDLYLGYYLHLVEDICYRHYIYDIYHWDYTIPGNKEKLHKDFAILNKYIINKYHLKNDLIIPDGFELEPINNLCVFDVNKQMEAMETYFNSSVDGDMFFFTEEMTDTYIMNAFNLCCKELEAIRNSKPLMDSHEWAWIQTHTMKHMDMGN